MSEFPPTEGPPPHILALLEPAMRIRRRSPLRDPHDPTHWWRVLPNGNSDFHKKPVGSIWEKTRRLDPGQAVVVAERHFEFLRSLGIENPNVQRIIDHGNRPEGPRLYSLNEHVTGITDSELSVHKELRPMFRLIGDRLLRYAD